MIYIYNSSISITLNFVLKQKKQQEKNRNHVLFDFFKSEIYSNSSLDCGPYGIVAINLSKITVEQIFDVYE